MSSPDAQDAKNGEAALTIVMTDVDGVPALQVQGEIDLVTAKDLRAHLDAAIAGSNGDVVVDLSKVGFMDSTGIAQLIAAAGDLTAGRSLVLQQPSGTVLKVIEITGLDSVPTVVVR